MIDDRLRDALRAEVDGVHAGPDAYERLERRLERRLGAPASRPLRPLVLAAAAAVVVAALVAGVLALRDPSERPEPAAPAPGPMPGRILVVTSDGRPALLDARTGAVLRRSVADAEPGTPVAVTPDGRTFFFTSRADRRCDRSVQARPVEPGPGSATVAEHAFSPAVSPDGRYLVFSRCDASGRATELVLRDLRSGTERVTTAPPGQTFGERLYFDADARHVVLELVQPAPPSADGIATMRRVDLVGGEAMPGEPLGIAPTAVLGRFGGTGDHLGRLGGPPRDVVVRLHESPRARRGQPRPFHVTPLFRVPGRATAAVADPTGDHVLAVADGTLYRWSPGDDRPTRLLDGVVAAAWVPDPAPSFARLDARGRLSVLDGEGHELRGLGRVPEAGTIVAAPDGRSLLVDSGIVEPCASARAPHVLRIDTGTGRRSQLSSGRFPAVSPTGLVAFEVRCDGVTLGFTDLATGESSRTNPLLDGPSEISTAVTGVHPIAWSPDGTSLLYLVDRRGGASQFVVGRLWPAVASGDQAVVPLADSGTWEWATFLDDTHLAVLVRDGATTEVRVVEIPRDGGSVDDGVPQLEVRGRASRIWAAADGSILVFRPGASTGDLFRWRRGEPLARVARGWTVVPLVVP